MKKVSVIIPTWNSRTTILKAILSILSQTMPPFEILVCDDGSTDNTSGIVNSLNNPKVKWIAGKHSGLPAVARNRGIRESKGEWLAFLDSDDWWEKNKLERQLELVKKLKVKAVCSNAYVVSPHSNKKQGLYFSNKEVKDVFGFNELLKANFVICSSMLIEKQLVLDCGGFPKEPALKAIEDYALWLRVSTRTKIAYSNKPLVSYFNDPDNSIRSVWRNVKLQKKTILKEIFKWLTRNINKNSKNLLFLIKTLIQYFKSVVFSY